MNRYANFLWDRGFRKGDAVAILLENRPEVLVTVGALAKIGAVASLINTNQRKRRSCAQYQGNQSKSCSRW